MRRKLLLAVMLISFANAAFTQSNKDFEKFKKFNNYLVAKSPIKNHSLKLKATSELKERIDSLIMQAFDGSWHDQQKQYYTYDNSNNIVQFESHVLDLYSEKWIGEYKEIYTYNTNDKVSQMLSYYWDDINDKWEDQAYKTVYNYDSEHRLTKEQGYHYNITSKSWEQSSETTYQYSQNGNLQNQIYYTYNSFENKYNPYAKDMYYYNSNNLTIADTFFIYNSTNENWETNTADAYSYDTNNNVKEIICRTYDEVDKQWTCYNKITYTYDLSVSLDELIFPEDSYNFANKPISMNLYMPLGEDIWQEIGRVTVHYSNVSTTSIHPLESSKINIYPNPTSEFISINNQELKGTNTFELFDLKGNKLMSKVINPNKKISLQNLCNGHYIYTVTSNGKIFKGKIIKK
jgi:hypothetical protein